MKTSRLKEALRMNPLARVWRPIIVWHQLTYLELIRVSSSGGGIASSDVGLLNSAVTI